MRFSIRRFLHRRKPQAEPVFDPTVAPSAISVDDPKLWFWRRVGDWEDVPVTLATPEELSAIQAGTLKVYRSA